MTTDTTERGLERLICTAMTGVACDPGTAPTSTAESPGTYGGLGYICGSPADYDRDHAVDLAQLSGFLATTQDDALDALDLANASPTRQKFLARLQGVVTKRGVIDLLGRKARSNAADAIHHADHRRTGVRAAAGNDWGCAHCERA